MGISENYCLGRISLQTSLAFILENGKYSNPPTGLSSRAKRLRGQVLESQCLPGFIAHVCYQQL